MEQERRTSGGQRVPFEALVVVASPKGGTGAYECEAVNLSENGMHLRTAYLPEQGQRLTFRFDTGSGEVTLEGEVVWLQEQARGGEFGVRFVNVNDGSLAVLRETLGLGNEGEAAPATVAAEKVTRGSRVRLHIDGLGSPMRARVRDDHTGEVQVGSNLDFLKVGKPLEMEDVEHGKRRGAVVDKVEVEVDPASKVPQLVVTLKYEEAGKAADLAKAAAGVKAAPTSDRSGSKVSSDSKKAQPRKDEGDKAEGDKADASEARADGEEGAEGSPNIKETLAQAGARVTAMSATARAAVGNLIERIRARRESEKEAASAEEVQPKRRVTAPPPDLEVKTSSRRQSSTEDTVDNNSGNNEEINGIEETDEETLKIRKKQRTLIAAGAGLMAVLLVVFGVRAKSATPPGGAEAASVAETTAAATAALPAPAALGSADVVSANVPLFGNTPLSTTEPAPLPAPAVAASNAPKADANPVAQAGDDDDDKGEAGSGKTEFGKGDVKKPRTVRIKMDAPITDLRGSSSDDAFTLFLPGRRNVEPAAPLSKRDKRLENVKAVPKDGGVELTFAFKDGIPPFLAKANGKMLEVDLGETPKDDGDDEGKTASADKKKGKKKVAKGSKAADKKKATAKKAKKAKKVKKASEDD